MTDTPTAELVAALRATAGHHNEPDEADERAWLLKAAERLERLEAECERLRKSWGLTMQSRQVWRRLAESVAQMVLDTATVETPPELLKAAREALGE